MLRSAPRALLLLAATLASLTLTGCGTDAQSKEPDEPDEQAAVPVETILARTGPISAVFSGTASIEAEDEAVVVARASGIIEGIQTEEGRYVRVGATLATLDTDRLNLELSRASVAFEKAQRDHARMKGLFEKQLVSAEEYERTRTDLEAQQAALELARLGVDEAVVRAPISGIIAERMVKTGNMVQMHSPTFRIVSFDPLLAVVYAPERELGRLEVGQDAALTADALGGETFTGRVERISPIVDPATGTFKVTIAVRDRSRRLRPGLFTRVAIATDTRGEALLIPKGALLREDDEAAVYVVRDSLAFRQVVATGYETDADVEITRGLEPGARVVTLGQAALADSAKVLVLD